MLLIITAKAVARFMSFDGIWA